MVLKAKIFVLTNQGPKGLTIALRAAVLSQQHYLLSILTAAIRVLSQILIELREFDAARELLEAAMPHVSTSQPALML